MNFKLHITLMAFAQRSTNTTNNSTKHDTSRNGKKIPISDGEPETLTRTRFDRGIPKLTWGGWEWVIPKLKSGDEDTPSPRP